MDENAHAIRVLEFDKIKEALRGLASSVLGREAIGELQPYTYAQAIRGALAETSEYLRLLQTRQEPSLTGLYDIREPLQRSRNTGSILDPAEILIIGETVSAARRIQEALRQTAQTAPRLKVYGGRLVPHPGLEDSLARVFDDQKSIRDTASRDLSRIRKSLRQLRADITRRLDRLIRGSFSDYLAEPYYTLREERYVLPVDARYQSKVPGIIHDRSTTGATVFIEPMRLVEDGNRLMDFNREEQIEVRKILRELTAQIAERSHDIEQNLEIFCRLDEISAKAKFSDLHEMNEPVIVEDGSLKLTNARHPLLVAQMGQRSVVPLNLHFPDGVRGIIITGPNTGGKTVVLKTIGLFALMAQCGMHVPADPGVELPVYKRICADIGDEQSLEQSLSTFSSHMNNIKNILETADKDTLVLLDELGSGTDPEEGGALACAIVEQLYKQHCTFLTTTHLQELKLFAHENEGVDNGAMEFDLKSLRPTYRFTLGLPGRSNAISIASRLGLPQHVIDRARVSQREQDDTPEALLSRLSEEMRCAEEAARKALQERKSAEELRADCERRVESAKREARHIIEKGERKAQNLLSELERRIKDLEKEEQKFQQRWKEKLDALLKESKREAPPESTLKQLRAGLKQAKKQVSGSEPAPHVAKYKRTNWRWEQLKPGMRVRIAGLTEMGKVLRVWPDQKKAEVSVNSMTLQVKQDQILSVHETQHEPTVEYLSTVQVDRPDDAELSVDIHGMTVDEMTPIVERFVDRGFRSGARFITIVHGHGTGTLRREVRRMLSEHPVVRNFKNGESFEGGQGVTIVNLSSRM
ncbi:MAG: endonuclease MutS2 [Candidatus Hinthialibacter antarcticus]|nr:endonuclease MutS2 [Candidatus Hinthialibacter antarcticus]